MSEIIHPIVFASDANGALQLGIALYSLLSTANNSTKYRIYILDDHIDKIDKDKIESLHDQFDFELQFIPIHHLVSQYANKSKSWPPAVYARMFAASLLPDESIVLYTDIDVLFCRDISDIFNTDFEGHIIGAVSQVQDEMADDWKRRLSIPDRYPYYNSGVLLMNLELIRKDNIEELFISYLHGHADILICPDQDVINAVLYERIMPLHPKWNWPHSHARKMLFRSPFKYSAFWGSGDYLTTLEAAYHPYIIHYIGLPKPINFNYKYTGNLYREAWLQSPWKDIPVTGNKRIKYAIRKILYKPLDYLTERKMDRIAKQYDPLLYREKTKKH